MKLFGLAVGLFMSVGGRAWAHHDMFVDNVGHEILAAVLGAFFGIGGSLIWTKMYTSKTWKIAYSVAVLGVFVAAMFGLTWFHQAESW